MRPSRFACRTLVVAVALSLLAPAVAAADDRPILLGGETISVGQAADLSCHDLDQAAIHCFMDSSEMEAAIADLLGNLRDGGEGLLVVGYVTVYEDASYSGAARTLSTDYADLGSIGWNDRISSFKSFGATGNFREHTPAGGFVYSYSSGVTVPTLNGTYNDKFSLFNIN